MTDGHSTPGVVAGSLQLGNEKLATQISRGLEDVEDILYRELSQGAEFVTDKVLHLVRAGGKRFRPMFALLASEYGKRPLSEEVVKAAALVEMTHLATLYHDDVMDEAQQRRGVPSANARWGNSVAILAGDHLLAQASAVMAQLGVETVKHFSETFAELVTGQMRETIGPEGKDPVEHYLTVIREKTGVLVASAGYLGGVHSGAPAAITQALRGFGYAMGMIFQIVDDIIDIFSTPEESGKLRGTDLREGVFTLPVLYAMEDQSEAGGRLRELLHDGPVPEDTVAEVLDLIGHTDARVRTLEAVRSYRNEAESYLAQLPDNEVTTALRTLAEYSSSRVG